MVLKFDPQFSPDRQMEGFRVDRNVNRAEVSAALATLDDAGFRLEDIQGVLGKVVRDWTSTEDEIVVGLAHAYALGCLSREEFEEFAHQVWNALSETPSGWDPDLSAADLLLMDEMCTFSRADNLDDLD